MPDLDEAIDALRRRTAPVPLPLRLPTESDVRDTEERAGIDFPGDFRRYLLEASDVVFGTLEPVTIGVGHTAFDAVLDRARESGFPNGLIPICEDNGDYYCVTPGGTVAYWSHNGETDECWPNLATWMVEVWIGGE